MPHIHTDPGQYDLGASAFIVRVDGDEPQLVLHRHKKLGKYTPFGGHVELDETPWRAIIHELREESGYDIGQLKVLQPKTRILKLAGAILHPYPVCQDSYPYTDQHFHTDTIYAFTTTVEPRHTVSDSESSDIQLLTRRELVLLPEGEIWESMRQIGMFVFDECLPNWEQASTELWA